jgi:outer membrane lipoprotein-sorting protein
MFRAVEPVRSSARDGTFAHSQPPRSPSEGQMIRARTLGLLLMILAFPVVASAQGAQDLSDLDILVAADSHRGDVHGVTWALTVAEQDGTSTEMVVQARNQNFLAVYRSPSAQAGQKILERGQNMWFIAPNTSRPVPISPRQKLLGAASYGDIAGQRWSADYRPVSRDESMEDGKSIIIMNVVATSPMATYDALTLYINAEDLYVIRSEMKASNGDVLKTATYTYGNKVPGRHTEASGQFDSAGFISETVITDRSNARTTLRYRDVRFRPIPAQTFILSNVMATP